jgi:hypothetical protein
MRKTVEQRLAEIERTRARLAAKIRADATREKIVIGAAIAAEMRENHRFAEEIKKLLLARVTRDADKRAVARIIEFSPPTLSANRENTEEEQSEFVSSDNSAPTDLIIPSMISRRRP